VLLLQGSSSAHHPFYCVFHSEDYTHPTQQQQIDFSWNEKLCICICCWQNP
jgi:hypothetical protein